MIPFISAEDLSAFVGRTIDAGELLTGIALDTGAQSVRDYLDQQVNYQENDVVIVRGAGQTTITLPEMPIISVESITIDGVALDEADYRISGRSRVELLNGDVWTIGSEIVVTYTHGYGVEETDFDNDPAPDNVPSSIRMKALELAAVTLVAGRTGVGGVESETIGHYAYTLKADGTSVIYLTEEQGYSINRYRQEGVA